MNTRELDRDGSAGLRAYRPGLIRLAAWPAVVLTSVYLVFVGGGWVGLHSVTLRTTSVLIGAIALGAWGVAMIPRPAWRPRSRLLPALGAGLATFAVSTALSPQPRLGLDYLAYAVVLSGFYLLLVRLFADPWFRPRMQALIVVIAVIVGAWFVEAVVAKWIEWWGLVGRVTTPPLRPEFESLTFGNPSAVMTMSLLLTIPAVAWIGISSRRRAVAAGLLIGLALLVTLLSGSRAGWLGLAIGVVASSALWLAVADHRAALRRTIGSPLIRVALGAGAVLGVAMAVTFLPGVLSRAGAGGEELRASLVENALRQFSDSPLVGAGPGTWVAQRIGFTPAGTIDYYIPHAHNVYAQTLAEFGLLGAMAGLIAAFGVGRVVIRAIRSGDRERVWVGWATVLALAYFAAHNILDFYPSFPPALFAAVIPIAWLDAREPAAGGGWRHGRAVNVAFPLVGAFALAVATGWLLWSEGQAVVHDRAVIGINRGDSSNALAAARLAAVADPGIAAYHLTRAIAAADNGIDQEAADAFARAAAMDELPNSWLGLAAADLRLGNRAGATDALGRALRLGSQQPAIVLAAASLERQLDAEERAIALFEDLLVAVPSLGGDPGFRALVGAPVEALADRAMARLGDTSGAIELALARRQPGAAAAIANRLEGDTGTILRLVVAGWAGEPRSRATLATFAVDHPFDQVALGWNARLARQVGDTAGAARYERWSNLVNVYSGFLSRPVRISHNASDAGTAGSTAQFYGHYTYRRPTPWDLIPASLPHLTDR